MLNLVKDRLWVRHQVEYFGGCREEILKPYLDGERAAMGERWFRQEYLCEFEDTVSGVFSREQVESAFSEDVKPLIL